jgi:hypothetical protein
MAPLAQVRIGGLTRLEALEIHYQVGEARVSVVDRQEDADAYHELGTAAILLMQVTPAVMRVVAEQLDRRDKARRRAGTVTVERVMDGRTERYTLDAASPIMEQLERILKAD